jgi:flavin-binding protein dodecin
MVMKEEEYRTHILFSEFVTHDVRSFIVEKPNGYQYEPGQETSFEDAIQLGIATASKTVNNIQSAWVKELKVVVEDDTVSRYRVDLKITFVVS